MIDPAYIAAGAALLGAGLSSGLTYMAIRQSARIAADGAAQAKFQESYLRRLETAEKVASDARREAADAAQDAASAQLLHIRCERRVSILVGACIAHGVEIPAEAMSED